MPHILIVMIALALASCAERPRPITAADMEQIARDWQADDTEVRYGR